MTPTLMGRLQTRIFLAATLGALWTAAITPALAQLAGMTSIRAYHMTFPVLGLMTLLGLGWEVIYHVVQQTRWDKDWPSVFALLVVVPEAIPLWYIAHLLHVIPGTVRLSSPFISLYTVHVGTTWLLIWLFMQGPLRVMHLRWRFEGGRVLALAPGRLRRRCAWPDAVAWPESVVGGAAESGAAESAAAAAAVSAPAEAAVAPAPAEAETAGKDTAGKDIAKTDTAAKPAAVEEASPPARPEPGRLTQGVLCRHGHFSHPQARYCVVCGVGVVPRTDPVAYGHRPPAGILILADGSTAVLDHDLTLTASEPDGDLGFHPAGEYPRTVAQIKLVGWQPVVSCPVRAMWLFLPGGSNLRIEPNVPVPLVPGAELTLGRYRLRYESPHQGWLTGLDPSMISVSPSPVAASEPRPSTSGRRRRQAGAVPAAVGARSSVATGQPAISQPATSETTASQKTDEQTAPEQTPTGPASAEPATASTTSATTTTEPATAAAQKGRWVTRSDQNGWQVAADETAIHHPDSAA